MLHFLILQSSVFYRKNRNESANASPAPPMDTWTAERAFARSSIKSSSAKNNFFAEY